MALNEKAQRISVQGDMTLVQAMRRMDELDRKLLLVFKGGHFLGVLSVGDIQRAIIRNHPLETPVADVMRASMRMARDTDDRERVRQLMLDFRTECMPMVDASGALVDVLFWEDEFPVTMHRDERKLEVPVVIMAGGLGSRLKPLTNIIPKPLVPIGEKPIIQLIIEGFRRLGVKEFHLTVNYKHEMIRYFFDHLEGRDYSVDYVLEDRPLGTAGSLQLLKDRLKGRFFVSNCDILVDQDHRAIHDYHVENRNDITLVGVLKHYHIPYGTLETGAGGELLGMREKPDLTFMVNSGLYILERHVIDLIPEGGHMDITTLIEQVRAGGGRVGVFPVSERSWFDIGEWNEYQTTLKEAGRRFDLG
jgi:dTDP-glucose pyrophosphorylase